VIHELLAQHAELLFGGVVRRGVLAFRQFKIEQIGRRLGLPDFALQRGPQRIQLVGREGFSPPVPAQPLRQGSDTVTWRLFTHTAMRASRTGLPCVAPAKRLVGTVYLRLCKPHPSQQRRLYHAILDI
jgi:hypothetical protein